MDDTPVVSDEFDRRLPVGDTWSALTAGRLTATIDSRNPLRGPAIDDSGAEQTVEQVRAVNDALNDAVARGDAEALRKLLSRDLVVSDPSNTIRHRDDLIGLFAGGQVAYREIELRVDHVEALGSDLAVVLGWEITVPDALPEDTGLGGTVGRALRRRFTNVFRREDGAWRLIVKQSTITAIEEAAPGDGDP